MTEIASLGDLEGTPHATVFDDDPRTVRLRLSAGERVPAHRHPGTTVLLYLLEGRLELSVGGETHDLEAGDLARFDGDSEVSPLATEDATALVVLAPRP